MNRLADLGLVQPIGLSGVLHREQSALQLHRDGYLVTAGLPERGQHAEPLDLLDPGQFRVMTVFLSRK